VATQTYGTLTAAQRNAYNDVLLDRAEPLAPGFDDGAKARIPERQGTTMEWRVYGGSAVATTGAGLALATTALTEGVPPTESQITVAKVTKAVQQFGAFVKLSDLLVHQGIDPIWAEAFAMLGEQAGQTLHTLLMNDLAGGTNVQYAGAATTRGTVSTAMLMSDAEVREAVRNLQRGKVMRFPDGFYHGIIHVDCAYDLMGDTNWQNSNVYVGGQTDGNNSMISGQIRDWRGVRWYQTTDAPYFGTVGAASAPVYGTFVYGPRWFGTVDLDAQGMPGINGANAEARGLSIRAVPVDTETKDDPLGQFGTAGWKATYGGIVLSGWKGVRVESSASA
jgi:N4-gp56 family major capsid protein